MKRRVAYWLARLYPAAWRERYGEEFDALVEDSRPGWRGLADIAWSALAMQWRTGPTPLWSALSVGLLGIAIAAPVSLSIPDAYISVAAVTVPASGLEAGHAVALAQQAALRRKTLSELIQRHRIYGEPASEASLERFQRNISISGLQALRSAPGKSAFRVGFVHEDVNKAQAVARELMTLVIDEYARQNGGVKPGIEVLDMPSLPTQPIYPNRPVILLIGLLAGGALGALISLVRRGGTIQMLRWAVIGAVAGAVLLPSLSFISIRLSLRPVTVAELAVRGDSGGAEAVGRSVKTVMSGESLAALAARYKLGTVAELRNRLSVTYLPSGPGAAGSIRLTLHHPDRQIAEAALGGLVASLLAEHGRQPGAATPATLEVRQPPNTTKRWPAFPTQPMAFGGFLGAALGICAAAFRHRPVLRPEAPV